MKLLIIAAFIVLVKVDVNAQKQLDKVAKNSIYVELLGIGGYFSINYERMLYVQNRFATGIRIGYTSYEYRDFNDDFNPDIIVPMSINNIYGGNHHVEFGIGPTFSSIVKAHPTKFTPTRDLLINLNMNLGYRYQKPGGGLLFRIGYTPFFQIFRLSYSQFINEKSSFRHWAGISIGYSF